MCRKSRIGWERKDAKQEGAKLQLVCNVAVQPSSKRKHCWGCRGAKFNFLLLRYGLSTRCPVFKKVSGHTRLPQSTCLVCRAFPQMLMAVTKCSCKGIKRIGTTNELPFSLAMLLWLSSYVRARRHSHDGKCGLRSALYAKIASGRHSPHIRHSFATHSPL